MLKGWKQLTIRIFLILWSLQLIWLFWHFTPEIQDLARRIADRDVGAAVRRENPMYTWARSLARLIPPDATYVFMDNYEAGKYIQVRYYLPLRQQLLVFPTAPASLLFYTLHQEQASFLIIQGRHRPLSPGGQAASQAPALQLLKLSGPGLVFRVNYLELHWGFYD